jgi:hypothetical protein
MKWEKLVFLPLLLFAVGASDAAWAEHFHHGPRVGVYIGPGWGWRYPPPYYYDPYPPVTVVPAAPPTYVEQEPEQAPPQTQPQQSNYWYYCSKPDGYYPYVKQCPGGWQRVAPQPAPQP